MKHWIQNYFTFSKKERNAAIVLVAIIGLLIALPYWLVPKPTILDSKNNQLIKQQIDQLQKNQLTNNEEDPTSFFAENEITSFELFTFDPNTLDANGWKRLGLKDKTIHTIFNYISKGGKFRKPDDIRKIWGLSQNIADRIIPYVQINNATNEPNWESPSKKLAPIDINTASPEDFKDIPGITNGLQYRIVRFREKLGGFVSVQQIRETYGMSDSSFQLMKPFLLLTQMKVQQLNINTLSEADLGAHPYINSTLAKAIVIYRNQHGQYQSVSDLKKIVFIKDSTLQKITPYLTVQ